MMMNIEKFMNKNTDRVLYPVPNLRSSVFIDNIPNL